MNRYSLHQPYRVIDAETRTWTSTEDFWFIDQATGDIVTLTALVMLRSDSVDGGDHLMLGEDMVVVDKRTAQVIGRPLRETFVPPIDRLSLELTDRNGRVTACYRLRERGVDVRFCGEFHRVNFLPPGKDYFTLKDLEGQGDEDKLEKLKRFMTALRDAANMWEEL